MSDELLLRGGGSVAVATDTVFAEIARLAATAAIAEQWLTRMSVLQRDLDEAFVPNIFDWSPGGGFDLARARMALQSTVRELRDLSDDLRSAAHTYGATEAVVDSLIKEGGGIAAFLLGRATPLLAVASAGLVPHALMARHLVGADEADAALARVIDEHGPAILSHPSFVQLVRLAADSTDEYLLGLLGRPDLLPVAQAWGVEQNALMALAAVAVVNRMTGGRTLTETVVRVHQVAAPPTGPRSSNPTVAAANARAAPAVAIPPNGVHDLAIRIPSAVPGDPQIRIERYGTPDAPKWIVYSGGTVDFGFTPAREPFDSPSNVFAMAGLDGGGEKALREAMREVGIAPEDPVILAGHSAGAIITADLAADPAFNVVAVAGFGGPTAQSDTGSTPILSVAHTEDLVPATGGYATGSNTQTFVERSVADRLDEFDGPLPAHAMTLYEQTAAIIDESEAPQLIEFRDVVASFTDGSPGEVTYWRADRALSGSGGRSLAQ